MAIAVNGILLVDKSFAKTSNGVLQRVKHIFTAKKAGHTGSLDPLATGMLPICFGEATKFSQCLLDSDKTYIVTGKLGVQTASGDLESPVIATKPVVDVTPERIQQVLNSFIGEIDQVPPMFSAIKYDGKRLYELARRGIEIERRPRRVCIIAIHFMSLENDEVTFEVKCSKGTYIRSLVEDVGNALGCGAHVKALRRTAVTPYEGLRMYTMDELEAMLERDGPIAMQSLLLPLDTAVDVYPTVTLSESTAFYLRMGQAVRTVLPANTPIVKLVTEANVFLGLGEATDDGRVKPHRLIAT